MNPSNAMLKVLRQIGEGTEPRDQLEVIGAQCFGFIVIAEDGGWTLTDSGRAAIGKEGVEDA